MEYLHFFNNINTIKQISPQNETIQYKLKVNYVQWNDYQQYFVEIHFKHLNLFKGQCQPFFKILVIRMWDRTVVCDTNNLWDKGEFFSQGLTWLCTPKKSWHFPLIFTNRKALEPNRLPIQCRKKQKQNTKTIKPLKKKRKRKDIWRGAGAWCPTLS